MLAHLENRPPRIAVLGTHLALYADAYPNYEGIMRAFIEEQLAELGGAADVAAIDITCTVEQAQAFLRHAEDLHVDALVLISAGYTNSLSITPALCGTPLPLVILNTQGAEAVTTAFRFDDLLYNHGMQGVQDITAVLVRENRSFFIVTGRLADAETRAELMDYLVACRARAQVRGRRIAWITPPQWGMGDGLVEPERLNEAFGLEAFALPCEELAELAADVLPEEIAEAHRFDAEHFTLPSSLKQEDHERSLRLEIALRKLVARHELSGLTFSFDHIARTPGIETIPFLGITKLMGDGLAYGGEGDLLVTAWTAMAHCLAEPVSFTELYTMDFTDNTVLNTHMAELNWRLARKEAKPLVHAQVFSLAPCAPFCSLLFTLEPGPATLGALTLTGSGQFHIIHMNTEITGFPLLVNTWERPNYKIRFGRDVRQVMNEYALLGGPHHLCITPSRAARRFEAFGALCGCQASAIQTGVD